VQLTPPTTQRREPDGEQESPAGAFPAARRARPGVPQTQNTAGEWEPEARSPRQNMLEALAVYTAILVLLWPFAYGVGPWNVDVPHAGVLVFPLVCIAVFAGLMAWCALRLPADPPTVSDRG